MSNHPQHYMVVCRVDIIQHLHEFLIKSVDNATILMDSEID